MDRIFNKIVIMMTMLLSAVPLAGNAQETVLQAYDLPESEEPSDIEGLIWEDMCILSCSKNKATYTDKVAITLNDNHELGVLFLSQERQEVALTYYTQDRSGFRDAIIPDYIEYKGVRYKVVELRDVWLENKNVILPNTVRSLEGRCFVAISGSIQFGEGLESIGSGVFGKDPMLKELKFPNSLQRIYPNAITATRVPNNMFDTLCSILNKVEFSPNTYMIGSNNFNCFAEIEEIDLPYRLSELGENCFNNLLSLKKVHIGKFLTVMRNCFNNCPEIEEIIIDRQLHLDIENCFNAVDKSKCVVKVKTLNNLITDDPLYDSDFWKDFKIVEIDASGVETVINDPANGVYNTRWYDLSGRPLSSIDGLKRGEIYIECQGSKSEKKIMD